MNKFPLGFCQCGCGGRTKIPQYTDNYKRWIKGQPKCFLQGHNSRGKIGNKSSAWKGGKYIEPHGYTMIYYLSHPRANAQRYVREHILIAEKALGKPLPSKTQVHHQNEERSDNKTPGNLVICQDLAYHKLLHQRIRALKVCGHASWRKCTYCKKYDTPLNLTISNVPKGSVYHKTCAAKYERERKLSKGGTNGKRN